MFEGCYSTVEHSVLSQINGFCHILDNLLYSTVQCTYNVSLILGTITEKVVKTTIFSLQLLLNPAPLSCITVIYPLFTRKKTFFSHFLVLLASRVDYNLILPGP
jgi:hypothetical protein